MSILEKFIFRKPAQQFKLSGRSYANLKGVNPDLIRVVERAIQITKVDFCVTEGLRTEKRQAELMKAGASTVMNSRHLTGHAVDLAALVGGEVRWDWPLYDELAKAMKEAANQFDVKIVCGADWKKFPDGPHFELDRKFYP
jgi:peptidoglycan L-alanyl-D-glutamate endopeptidase CwlK